MGWSARRPHRIRLAAAGYGQPPERWFANSKRVVAAAGCIAEQREILRFEPPRVTRRYDQTCSIGYALLTMKTAGRAPARPRAVFEFRSADGKIVSIEMVADPERLGQLQLEVLS